jgi:leucyl aminopeptidase
LASPELLASLGSTGKTGEVLRLPASALEDKLSAPVLAVAGLGEPDPAAGLESLRRSLGAALRQLTTAGSGVSEIGLGFAAGPGRPPVTAAPACLAAVAEGALLGADDAARLVLAQPDLSEPAAKKGRQILARAQSLAAAVKLARRLTNEPANRLNPQTFADQASAAVKGTGIRVKVLGEADLAKGAYGGILAVGQGSVHPPRLVKLSYSPLRAKRHVALVGKGITFDSGGLSLKSRASMLTMKSDMAGAAAVLAAMRAASDIKLPVKVTGSLCLAENMPSGAASRPGDVIIMKDGHAVEVTNTDAEGRLVLADGIAAARAAGADQIIDIATLTGAQVVALGNRVAGIMGSEDVRDGLVAAADQAGEGAWAMPLPSYLMEVFRSEVADFTNANLTDSAGGMLSAGLFLRQFAGDVPWAHIDCAGPAFNSGEPFGYTPKGGTGFGVRTLVRYLEEVSS